MDPYRSQNRSISFAQMAALAVVVVVGAIYVQADTTPVFRFWSDSYGGHFFTINVDERDYVISA
jgi:hypothetical protein